MKKPIPLHLTGMERNIIRWELHAIFNSLPPHQRNINNYYELCLQKYNSVLESWGQEKFNPYE